MHELRNYLSKHQTGEFQLTSDCLEKILIFYEFLLQENQSQNLTRLISPADFYYGHFLDTWELLKSGLLDFPTLDLGSGVGVPGLLGAIISPSFFPTRLTTAKKPVNWVLAESEKRKADYLLRAVEMTQIGSHAEVFCGRGEDYLKTSTVETVTARAVGPLERIHGWIRKCSTWNKLVLLKGPGWTSEWESFQNSKFRVELKILNEYHYVIGPEKKSRVLIQLARLP